MDTKDIGELFSLQGRTALISGASSGIGLHAAQTLFAAGASVALAARRSDKLAEAVRRIDPSGKRACAVQLDVTDSSTIAPAFDAAEQALGAPVDIFVNNAGVLFAQRFVEQPEDKLDWLFDTNLKGAFLVAQEAARRMSRVGRGSIINISSSSALRAAGMLSSYASSKAALLHLGSVMALELAGKGIRVNTICPGNIETDMQESLADFEQVLIKRTPMRRFGKPEDLDGALLLLASDAGRYMTGAVITVDGGQTLSWM